MAVGDFKGEVGTFTTGGGTETAKTLQPASGEVWLVRGIWAHFDSSTSETKEIFVELYDGATQVIPISTQSTDATKVGLMTGNCCFNTGQGNGTGTGAWAKMNGGSADYFLQSGLTNQHYTDHKWSNWGGALTIDNTTYLRLRIRATTASIVQWYIDAVQIK